MFLLGVSCFCGLRTFGDNGIGGEVGRFIHMVELHRASAARNQCRQLTRDMVH